MLYSEFIEATGAKDTEYNYSVYKNLEALYMINDSMTKSDVYKAAKTLIDNSETEAEKEVKKLIEEAKKQITESESIIKHYRERIETMKYFIEISSPEEAKAYKDSIKAYRAEIRKEKRWIDRQKFFIKITA